MTLLRRLEIYDPPVDVDKIADRLGVHVFYEEGFPEGAAGQVEISEDPPRATICVRRGDPPVRRRFTIAHEIGHLMLHREERAHRAVVFEGDPKERQANDYAANLLMPAFMVRQYAVAAGYDARRLARLFQVSEQAMKYRLDNLGIRH